MDLALLPVCRALGRRPRCGKLRRFREKTEDAAAIRQEYRMASLPDCVILSQLSLSDWERLDQVLRFIFIPRTKAMYAS